MTERKTLFDFQADLEGTLFPDDIGPHGGGHFTIA
jgi:tyrosinase